MGVKRTIRTSTFVDKNITRTYHVWDQVGGQNVWGFGPSPTETTATGGTVGPWEDHGGQS